MLDSATIQSIVERGRVYDLGQPLAMGMPSHPAHPPYIFTLLRRHGDVFRPGGYSSANEVIVLSGHTGTHLDGLGHISEQGKLHGGVDAAEAQTGGRGLRQLGVESVPPIVARGVLLDVAGYRGVEMLPGGYAITAEELETVAKHQQVEVLRGDVVLIRTGWIRQWDDVPAYVGERTGCPGPDASAAEWLAARGVRASGSDTVPYEVTRPGDPSMPVHMILIARSGIHILEMVNLEELARDRVYTFLFVVAPLKIVGATGSPVRPLAIA
ncbi:MAG TPA: cyclase family protein [Chloroflexota bacterium]